MSNFKIKISLAIHNFLFFLNICTIQANVTIPDSFDSRDQWPSCESIGKIRNESNCSAGWAFAAVSTMSDRLCIVTEGRIKFEFSPQELLSCCPDCGACDYGNVASGMQSLKYWIENGIVSGGEYGDATASCMPYSEATALNQQIPPCQKTCQSNYSYSKTFSEDKRFGEGYNYAIIPIEDIQTEIMTNGPILAGFLIYDDLLEYKRGVYYRTSFSTYLGYTYGKIIGWGIEDERPYWLMAMSWGTQWGQSGYVQFLRGENELNVELNMFAIRPDVSSASSLSVLGCTVFVNMIFLITNLR